MIFRKNAMDGIRCLKSDRDYVTIECNKILEREKRDDLFPVFDFIGAAAGHDDFPQWTVGELLQYVRHQFFCPLNRGSSFDFVSEMQRKEKNPFSWRACVCVSGGLHGHRYGYQQQLVYPCHRCHSYDRAFRHWADDFFCGGGSSWLVWH